MAVSAKNRARQDERANCPERSCAVSRLCRPIDQLIRFVLSPDDVIVPDLSNRLPGRGIWVTATSDNVAKAIKTKAFQRSARKNVIVPDDLPKRIEHLLILKMTQTLAMANKAGYVVTGFSKVETALKRDGTAALIHGTEAAEDGSAKLDRKFKAIKLSHNQVAHIVASLTIDQLSLALGRENVVHAAIASSGVAKSFLNAANRLTRFRAGFEDNLTVKTPQIAKAEHG